MTPDSEKRRPGGGDAHLTTNQPSVRPAGVTLAADNADPWWFDGALRSIEHHAQSGRVFGADQVRDDVGDPERPCQMGAAFAVAYRAGLIRPVGFIVSKRHLRAGGVLRQWVGVA